MYQGGIRHATDPTAPLVVTTAGAADPWSAGTGLAAGESFPDLVGYEWSGVVQNCVPYPQTTLFGNPGLGADTTRYTTPSGSQVFDAGSLQFTWALDDWQGHDEPAVPELQNFMRNALDALSRPLAPRSVSAMVSGSAIRISLQPSNDPRTIRYEVVRNGAAASVAREQWEVGLQYQRPHLRR